MTALTSPPQDKFSTPRSIWNHYNTTLGLNEQRGVANSVTCACCKLTIPAKSVVLTDGGGNFMHADAATCIENLTDTARIAAARAIEEGRLSLPRRFNAGDARNPSPEDYERFAARLDAQAQQTSPKAKRPRRQHTGGTIDDDQADKYVRAWQRHRQRGYTDDIIMLSRKKDGIKHCAACEKRLNRTAITNGRGGYLHTSPAECRFACEVTKGLIHKAPTTRLSDLPKEGALTKQGQPQPAVASNGRRPGPAQKQTAVAQTTTAAPPEHAEWIDVVDPRTAEVRRVAINPIVIPDLPPMLPPGPVTAPAAYLPAFTKTTPKDIGYNQWAHWKRFGYVLIGSMSDHRVARIIEVEQGANRVPRRIVLQRCDGKQEQITAQPVRFNGLGSLLAVVDGENQRTIELDGAVMHTTEAIKLRLIPLDGAIMHLKQLRVKRALEKSNQALKAARAARGDINDEWWPGKWSGSPSATTQFINFVAAVLHDFSDVETPDVQQALRDIFDATTLADLDARHLTHNQAIEAIRAYGEKRMAAQAQLAVTVTDLDPALTEKTTPGEAETKLYTAITDTLYNLGVPRDQHHLLLSRMHPGWMADPRTFSLPLLQYLHKLLEKHGLIAIQPAHTSGGVLRMVTRQLHVKRLPTRERGDLYIQFKPMKAFGRLSLLNRYGLSGRDLADGQVIHFATPVSVMARSLKANDRRDRNLHIFATNIIADIIPVEESAATGDARPAA